MRWVLCLAVLLAACGPSTSTKAAYERKNEALLDEYSTAGKASTSSWRYGTNHNWGLTTARTYVVATERPPASFAHAVAGRLEPKRWLCSPVETADAAYTGVQCLRDTAVLDVGFRQRDAHHVTVELGADWNERTSEFNDD
jgi:hypothetical protein